ncbi:MAG TPA: GGDEF domain-containing protein, partial [Acidobacteriota bacterium]|nr:GGDEF domain-containing protein [Acidobacteriota bacterium]
FKLVNDTFGHSTGDLVLKAVAEALRQSLRASDSAGRWGGEEFVVLMPDTDKAGAAAVLEKIRRAVAEASFPAPAQSLRVTASAGFTQYGGGKQSPEDLLYAADRALYKAKEAGRDCICVSL